MIDVYYLSLKKETPNNDYWDYGLINELFNNQLWQTETYQTHEVSNLPKKQKAVVVVPARHHAGLELELNKQLNKINNVVLFLMGDEEASFAVEKIIHSSINIWVQNPHPTKHDNYNKLGTTYPPQSQKILPKLPYNKTIPLFFSGQLTHRRRLEVIDGINEWIAQGNKAEFHTSKGFTQGLSHEEYYTKMASSQISPCPAGAIIPDSFRLFEALESMSFVLADNRNTQGTIENYWEWLFNEQPPFKMVNDWDVLVGWSYEVLEDWDNLIQQQTAWWIRWKRDFAYKVKEQVNG